MYSYLRRSQNEDFQVELEPGTSCSSSSLQPTLPVTQALPKSPKEILKTNLENSVVKANH